MIVVLDASAAAELATRGEHGMRFVNILLEADRVIAPDLYRAEVSNVMWKIGSLSKNSKGSANKDIYFEMASDCMDYVGEFIDTAELWEEALLESLTHKHPVYDLLYVVLARRHNAVFLTMDKKLKQLCSKIGVNCQ